MTGPTWRYIASGDYDTIIGYLKHVPKHYSIEINATNAEGDTFLVAAIKQYKIYGEEATYADRMEFIEGMLSNPEFKYKNSSLADGYISAFQHAAAIRDKGALERLIKYKDEKGIQTALGVFDVNGKKQWCLMYERYVKIYAESEQHHESDYKNKTYYGETSLYSKMLPCLREEAVAYQKRLLQSNPAEAKTIQSIIDATDSKIKAMANIPIVNDSSAYMYNDLVKALGLRACRHEPSLLKAMADNKAEVAAQSHVRIAKMEQKLDQAKAMQNTNNNARFFSPEEGTDKTPMGFEQEVAQLRTNYDRDMGQRRAEHTKQVEDTLKGLSIKR